MGLLDAARRRVAAAKDMKAHRDKVKFDPDDPLDREALYECIGVYAARQNSAIDADDAAKKARERFEPSMLSSKTYVVNAARRQLQQIAGGSMGILNCFRGKKSYVPYEHSHVAAETKRQATKPPPKTTTRRRAARHVPPRPGPPRGPPPGPVPPPQKTQASWHHFTTQEQQEDIDRWRREYARTYKPPDAWYKEQQKYDNMTDEEIRSEWEKMQREHQQQQQRNRYRSAPPPPPPPPPPPRSSPPPRSPQQEARANPNSADIYEVLGLILGEKVDRSASPAKVRKLCKKAYVRAHPDRRDGNSELFKQVYTLCNEFKARHGSG